MNRKSYFAVAAFLSLLLLCLSAYGQRLDGTLRGTVIGTVNNALSTMYSNIASDLFLNDRQFTGGARQMHLGVKLIF